MEHAPQEKQLTEDDIMNMSAEEIKELQRKNCIFCHIISGKVQSKKIFEDDDTLAILDINPANPGHILLLPREHYTIMPQMTDNDIGHLFMVAKALSHASLKALKAEGSNIFVANGIAAGQKAPHLIVHIVPRKSNDGISSFGLVRRKAEKEQLEGMYSSMLQKLKESMPENKAKLREHAAVPVNSASTSVHVEHISAPVVHEKKHGQDKENNSQQAKTLHEIFSHKDKKEAVETHPQGKTEAKGHASSAASGTQKDSAEEIDNRPEDEEQESEEKGSDESSQKEIDLSEIARVLLKK